MHENSDLNSSLWKQIGFQFAKFSFVHRTSVLLCKVHKRQMAPCHSFLKCCLYSELFLLLARSGLWIKRFTSGRHSSSAQSLVSKHINVVLFVGNSQECAALQCIISVNVYTQQAVFNGVHRIMFIYQYACIPAWVDVILIQQHSCMECMQRSCDRVHTSKKESVFSCILPAWEADNIVCSKSLIQAINTLIEQSSN